MDAIAVVQCDVEHLFFLRVNVPGLEPFSFHIRLDTGERFIERNGQDLCIFPYGVFPLRNIPAGTIRHIEAFQQLRLIMRCILRPDREHKHAQV